MTSIQDDLNHDGLIRPVALALLFSHVGSGLYSNGVVQGHMASKTLNNWNFRTSVVDRSDGGPDGRRR